MIVDFRCKETEKIWGEEHSKKLPHQIQKRVLDKLSQIHDAETLNDLKVPSGNKLEPLQGNRLGQHSIRINRQWRICFEWRDGDAYNVEIEDYHH